MKNVMYLLLACWLMPVSLRQAQNSQSIETLIEQAQKDLYNNPKQASFYAAQAEALLPENASDESRVRAMLLYCHAEQLLGNFDVSIKHLYDAEKYIAPANKQQKAQLYALMGRIYTKLGDHNKAIELNDKATSIFKAIGDSTSIADCYNQRGVTHLFMNESAVADRFFRRALAINRAQRDLKGIAANLNNLCLYEGDTEEKLTLIQEAITINKHLEAQWSLGENYNNMGKQYYYGKRYVQALEALQKAYEYAYDIGARELSCDN